MPSRMALAVAGDPVGIGGHHDPDELTGLEQRNAKIGDGRAERARSVGQIIEQRGETEKQQNRVRYMGKILGGAGR